MIADAITGGPIAGAYLDCCKTFLLLFGRRVFRSACFAGAGFAAGLRGRLGTGDVEFELVGLAIMGKGALGEGKLQFEVLDFVDG